MGLSTIVLPSASDSVPSDPIADMLSHLRCCGTIDSSYGNSEGAEAVSSKAAVQKRVRSREIVTAIVFVRVCAELFADALYRPTAFGQTNGCRSCRLTRALSFSRSPRTSADPGVGIAKLRKRKAGCDSQIENAEKCFTKFESCGGFELPGRKCSARSKPRITARYYLESGLLRSQQLYPVELQAQIRDEKTRNCISPAQM